MRRKLIGVVLICAVAMVKCQSEAKYTVIAKENASFNPSVEVIFHGENKQYRVFLKAHIDKRNTVQNLTLFESDKWISTIKKRLTTSEAILHLDGCEYYNTFSPQYLDFGDEIQLTFSHWSMNNCKFFTGLSIMHNKKL
jgi:hypothetical protein